MASDSRNHVEPIRIYRHVQDGGKGRGGAATVLTLLTPQRAINQTHTVVVISVDSDATDAVATDASQCTLASTPDSTLFMSRCLHFSSGSSRRRGRWLDHGRHAHRSPI